MTRTKSKRKTVTNSRPVKSAKSKTSKRPVPVIAASGAVATTRAGSKNAQVLAMLQDRAKRDRADHPITALRLIPSVDLALTAPRVLRLGLIAPGQALSAIDGTFSSTWLTAAGMASPASWQLKSNLVARIGLAFLCKLSIAVGTGSR